MMVSIRHPAVHLADSTDSSAGQEVLAAAAASIRDVLKSAGSAASVASLLVLACSGVPAGEVAAEPVLENAFANRLMHELEWETGLQTAIPIAVGLLGEPVLTSGVLTVRALMTADQLAHAMLVVLNLGGPGAVGAAALLMSAETEDGLLIQHVQLLPARADAQPARASSPDPGAGLIELSLPREETRVEGILESLRRITDTTLTQGDRLELIEGSAYGLGEMTLERVQQ